MKDILINAPGAGEWIMKLAGGRFNAVMDHSIASYRSGEFLGGFVLANYMGNAISVHDGAVDPRWCSREILAMLFDYIFVQLHCHKAYAPVASTNVRALDMDLRAGWRLEYILQNAMAPGVHVMLLAMEPSYCRWLGVSLKQYKPGVLFSG